MTTKHSLKLTYFDFHGGRGEVARLAMCIGGVEFDDERLSFAQWGEAKPNTPFGAVPLLEVDGSVLAQSNAINRFVGKLTNLYPSDPWQAALCDEIMEAVEDISPPITATMSIKDEEEKKAAREALVQGPLGYFLSRMQKLMERRGSEYFADNRLTVADLKVFVWVRPIIAGRLDHIPTDLPAQVAPLLVEHFERVNSHPKVKEYYDTRGGY